MLRKRLEFGLLMAGLLFCAGAKQTAYAADLQQEQIAEIQEGTDSYSTEASESEFETEGTSDALTIKKYKGTSQVVDLTKLFSGSQVVAIGQDAFRNNTSVKEVILPDTVTSIGICAFQDCKNLTTIEGTGNVTQIGNYAFIRCEQLASFDSTNATTIGQEVFRECKNLQKFVIAEGTTQIAAGAFYASGLLEVTLPSTCKEIGVNAFRETLLTEITIPDECLSIENGAFMDCNSLVSVLISEQSKLESVGSSFNKCTSLKSIVIPESCENIGDSCFSNDDGLETIEFRNPDTQLGVGVFYGQDDLTVYAEPGAVSTYMKTNFSDSGRYRYNRYTDTLTIKALPKTEYDYGESFSLDGLEIEADYTSDTAPAVEMVDLSACKISSFDEKKLGSQIITVEYGKAETSFEAKVFYQMEKANVSSVEDQVYTGAPVKPALKVIGAETGNVLSEGSQYTVSYSENCTDVGTVTAIITGIGTYKGTKEVTYQIIPKDITANDITMGEIKDEIYTGSAIEPEVMFYAGDQQLQSGKDYTVTYENNVNIGTASVTVSGVGNYTGTVTGQFQIEAPVGKVFTIGKYRYKITTGSTAEFTGLGKTGEKKVTVPKSITLGGSSFRVNSIAAKALYKNKKVTTVGIGNNVKTIGKSAFEGCKQLKSVTVGTGVTKINAKAFKNCSKLQTVTLRSKQIKSMGKESFKGIKSNAAIKVPSKKMASYKKMLKKTGLSSRAKIKKA